MRRLLFLLCALASCSGDPGFSRVEITEVSGGALPVRIDSREIRVQLGGISKARVVLYDTDNQVMPSGLRSRNTDILRVERAVGDSTYAFVAARMGKTQVELLADGAVVGTIPAEVVDQGAF